MRIVSVKLRNIKSYADPACLVEFRPGVNMIWGENGSGKTTIIEAIGFALFGALELDLKQFRRKGESEGEVVLTLEGMDERFYQVIRKIRTAADLEIRDFETNLKLSKTREDAQKWLTQTVGVEFGGFGKTLFENVLGVSQGRMIESFMLTPAGRKDIFEPILKIEGYQQTWDFLGKAQSELAGRVGAAKTNAARLDGQLLILPGIQEELEDLCKQIVADESSFTQANNLLKEQEETFREMDSRKQSLDYLEQQVTLTASELENAINAVKSSDLRRNEAAKAVVALESSRDGYMAYQISVESLTRFESERRERDRLLEALQKIEKRQSEISVSLADTVKQLEVIASAEQHIIDLEPNVRTQKLLEETMQQKRLDISVLEKSQDEYKKQAEKRRKLEKQFTDMEEALVRRQLVAVQLRDNQDKLNELLPMLNQYSQKAAELQNTLDQENQALNNLKLKEVEFLNLLRQLEANNAELDRDRQALCEIDRGLAERATLQASIEEQNRALEHEQARQTTAQNEQSNAAQQVMLLQERRELLQQVDTAECPVCKKPLDTHEAAEIEEEFAREIATLEKKQVEVKLEEKEAEKSIRQLKKSVKELAERRDRCPTPDNKQKIELAIARYEISIRELQAHLDGGKDIATKVGAQEIQVKAVRDEIKALEGQRSEQEDRRREIDRDISAQNSELTRLPQPSEARQLKSSIEECITEALKQEKIILSLENSTAELRQAQADLARLGNPTEAQAQLRGISNQRSNLEERQVALQTEQTGCNLQFSEIRDKLVAYAGLDQKVIDGIAQRDQRQPEYRHYLANQLAAENLPQRELELSSCIKAQKSFEDQLGDFSLKRDAIKEIFDPIHFQALSEMIRANHNKKAALETRLQLENQRAKEKQTEVERLLCIQKDFETASLEVGRLEKLAQVIQFVREGIRKAGPQIAQRRVKTVSYSANRIYRQILVASKVDRGADGSSDPGTLNWDNTYEVTVRRSGDDLVFKQLSGGEKMAAAIAIRIALLSQLTSNLRLLFLDEPTANMDDARRNQLSEQITHLEGLSQLFVITHDDSFERAAHHVLQVFKHHDVSTVIIKS